MAGSRPASPAEAAAAAKAATSRSSQPQEGDEGEQSDQYEAQPRAQGAAAARLPAAAGAPARRQSSRHSKKPEPYTPMPFRSPSEEDLTTEGMALRPVIAEKNRQELAAKASVPLCSMQAHKFKVRWRHALASSADKATGWATW